jgi:hypothetical protein
MNAQKEGHAMEMEDLAVCWLGRKSTLFRNAWRLSPVCSLFAVRLFDERLKTKSSRNYVNYTTEHFLCMKGTNDSISELRKERAGSL